VWREALDKLALISINLIKKMMMSSSSKSLLFLARTRRLRRIRRQLIKRCLRSKKIMLSPYLLLLVPPLRYDIKLF
jgi:hypothetical protein